MGAGLVSAPSPEKDRVFEIREIVELLARDGRETAKKAVRQVQRIGGRGLGLARKAALLRRDLESLAGSTADERRALMDRWIEGWARGQVQDRELSRFRAAMAVDRWRDRRVLLGTRLRREIFFNDDPLIRKALRELRQNVASRAVPPLFDPPEVRFDGDPMEDLQRLQIELETSILKGDGEARLQAAEQLTGLRASARFESAQGLDPTRYLFEDEARGRYVGYPGSMARSDRDAAIDAVEAMVDPEQAGPAAERFERALLADPGFGPRLGAEGRDAEESLRRAVTAGLGKREHEAWLAWPFDSEMGDLYDDPARVARVAVARVSRQIRLEQTFEWAARWQNQPQSRVDRMVRRKVTQGVALSVDRPELGSLTAAAAREQLRGFGERLRSRVLSENERSHLVRRVRVLREGLKAVESRSAVLESWVLHRGSTARAPHAPSLDKVPNLLPAKAAHWAAGVVLRVERQIEAELSRSI